MGKWDYRIVKNEDGAYVIYEIYYNEQGQPIGRISNAVVNTIYGSMEDAVEDLCLMVRDIVTKEEIKEPIEWADLPEGFDEVGKQFEDVDDLQNFFDELDDE